MSKRKPIDSYKAEIIDAMSCCGMRDIEGLQISSPTEIVAGVARSRFADDENFSVVVLSEQAGYKKGRALMSYIHKNKLGTVVRTPVVVNPNSGNQIRAFMWAIDEDKLCKFWEKNKDRIKCDSYEEDNYNGW